MTNSVSRKDKFDLPKGVIYLDGNSLGPPIRGTQEVLSQVVAHDWGTELIRAWNSADWMALPHVVGDKIARLIGAPEGSVATGDTLSIKVFQALAAALNMRPDRRVILSDAGNFPTDLYMAEGLIGTLGKGHELRTPSPELVADAIDEDVAVVMLTEVDYRTGRLHDMAAITKKAHAVGAVVIWDLAHSAGAIPVRIEESAAEFAVGCTYKYLNGGPGAPAFIYVRPDIVNSVKPALSGWLGHDAPFAMERHYRPAHSTERMRVGTPPILQLAALDHALGIWGDVNLDDLRAASIQLSETFIREVEARCPGLTLASPRNPHGRGSQVSFEFKNGYAAMQALIANGVIGDFRAPNIMRFGLTPLYLDEADVIEAAKILARVLDKELWRDPEFNVQSRVT